MKLFPYREAEWSTATAAESAICSYSGAEIRPGDAIYVTQEPGLADQQVLAQEYERYVRWRSYKFTLSA